MGTPRSPETAKLIAGILVEAVSSLEEVHAVLGSELGSIEAASEPYRWMESSYYESEMGRHPWRQFVSFITVVDPGDLPTVKRRTNAIEDRWRVDGARKVNIDPGYLSASKLVLASTKDAAHRIYVGDGIYCEATLRFAGGKWQPYSYTYRDYASERSVSFFRSVRARFLEQRRAHADAGGHALVAGAAPAAAPRDATPSRRSRAAVRV